MSESFVEILSSRAEVRPERVIHRFLAADGENEETALRFGDLDTRARALAARLAEAGAEGERVLILVPPGASNVVAFFGCLYAGSIAVPLAPPSRARADGRLRAIYERADASIVLADEATRARVTRSGELVDDTKRGPRWIDVSETDGERAAAFVPRMPGPDDIALLQFTSGSTGQPKGVQVSHGNLIANARRIEERFGDDERTIGVSWLPPYHDMGLMGGILQPVFLGAETVIMTPAAFIRRPLRWLEAIARYRATTSGGPDFAYGLCVEMADAAPADLDLSSWTLAFSGAEPVRAATLERFARAFAPFGFDPRAFYPCYGMAETTLFVTGGARGAGARTLVANAGALEKGSVVPDTGGRPLVSCGPPAVDALAIVDRETGRALPEHEVGEVWVRGPQVAQGYWNDPEATAAAFGAELAPGDGGYLRTGDLGFLDGGELFLTGRTKDLIVLRGRNLHPSDLEESAAASHPALSGAPVAAFAVEAFGEEAGSGERLVLVAEVARAARRGLDGDAVARALRRAIVEAHGADPHAIVLIRPGSLPRTSSGKVRRGATRGAYLDGSLPVLARWQASPRPGAARTAEAPSVSPRAPLRSTVRARLVHEVATAMGVGPEAVDPGEPWAAHGLDSIQGVRLVGRVSDWLGRELSPTLLYDYPTPDALTTYLAAEESPASGSAQAAGVDASDGIAVIGLAARFPGGEDARRWFEALVRGTDAIGPVPADRPGAEAWRAAAERTPAVARAGFLPDVDRSEIALFGLSPREARHVDPQQRLLLETAWRAFEDAGIAPERIAGTATGVFVGVSSPDYARLLAARGAGQPPIHAGTGNALSIAANRLSYRFDLRGPSLAIDTACSSSLVAVHQACLSLERGESAVALAGGVNLLLAPDLSEIFAEAGMLSPDGRCRTFDAAADGYVRGEGCGLLVLKPLARARGDGDRVLAVIRGSAVNQDGRSNGLTAPSGSSQQAVIRAALARAGVAPDEVEYVEAHGTGTPLGDPIEAEALRAVFGARPAGPGPLRVGSVKTNVGHLEAAAGVAGLIKVVLALGRERLPGQLHFDRPNPHAPIVRAAPERVSAAGEEAVNAGPLEVLTQTVPWPAARRRIAGVSSFGFGGTNAHVIVEGVPGVEGAGAVVESPVAAPPSAPTARGLWLSERDPDALAALARAAAQVLDVGDATLDALARELAAGRARLGERVAVVADRAAEASRVLRGWAAGERPPELIVPPSGAPDGELRVAFAFPGQGAQRVGMGAELYARDRAFRRQLDRCERVLREAAGFSLLELLHQTGEAAARRLAETRFTQPALFAVELCLAEVLLERGVRPDRLIGHSVGEYAAACLAGVFERDDALRLVARRAQLVQSLPTGGAMLAVRLPAERAASLAVGHDDVAVAVDNGAERSVLSGARRALEPIASALARDRIETRWLDVSHAFHSPLLEPILPAFGDAVAAVPLHAPRIDVLSNVTGRVAGPEMATPEYWVRQLRQPVRFREGLVSLLVDPPGAVVEVGPGIGSLSLARAAAEPQPAGGIAWLPILRDGEREDVGLARALGELFVRGAPLDGAAANEGVRSQAPQLPGVRFRRQRFWFEAGAGHARPTRRAAPDAHPLLGTPLDVPEPQGLSFEALVASESPAWLADHRVGQAVMMPAAAFAEVTLAAGRRALATEGPLELRDLTIGTALPLPPGCEVRLHTVATEVATGEVRVRTFSADPGATGVWTAHSEAVVVAPGEEAPLLELEVPETEEAEPRVVDPDALTRSFGAAGLHYGEAFRGIEALAVRRAKSGGGPVAVGIVRGVPGTSESRYGLPPTRLDACLQTLAPLVDGRQTLLPSGVRRLVVGSACSAWPERLEVRAWLAGPREANFEARTLDGDWLFALEGVSLAPVPGTSDADRERADALHAIEWIPRGRAAGARVRLPEPERVVGPMRRPFREALEGLSVQRYRAGVEALEARARTLARAITERVGFEEIAATSASTKHARLVARIRLLAAQAQPTPAPAPEDSAVAAEAELLERCAGRVLEVLAGTCDPIAELLFPSGDSSALRAIYRDTAGPALMNAQVARIVGEALTALDADEGLAVLEIGAGTGGTTETVLDRLPGSRSSYVFTDVGWPLVRSAIQRLASRHPHFDGRLLDVSRDPREQGFAPASADVAIAANVLHATPRLGETLEHVRSLLAPGGWLVLLEGTRRLAWLDLTFGLTDGWWCFDADPHRGAHPLLDSAGWTKALNEAGFDAVASLADGAGDPGQDVILARAPARAPYRRVRVIAGGDRIPGLTAALSEVLSGRDAEDATAPVEDAVVVARAFDDPAAGLPDRCALLLDAALDAARTWLAGSAAEAGGRLTFVTFGAAAVGSDGRWGPPGAAGVAEAGLWGGARALRLEQAGRCVRVVDVGEGVPIESLARELAAEDPEDEVALRRGGRFVPRLVSWVDETQPTRLDVAVPGHLDQLVQRPAKRQAPAPGEVELEVRATGLNFRDLLQALGMLGRGYSDALEAEHIPFGFECAGVVVRVGAGVEHPSPGAPVIACFTPGSLASHVTLPARFVVGKPDALGWAEAATLPTAWLTVWHALESLAGLAPGEWILVHAAAGGVGTAAVRHALGIGARVIATAHPSKWESLRAMGVRHVASTRDASFAERVREWTGEAGADVVLNSLSGDLALASLAVTAAGGRFVELGRVGGVDAETVRRRRPDVRYCAFDLGDLAIDGRETGALDALVQRFAEPGAAERLALPTTAFPVSEAEKAFRLLQTGRHVGKLALVRAPSAGRGAHRIDPMGTYLLSGGTGGLGLVVARWLVERGARHIALLARRSPTADVQKEIDALLRSGARVDALQADVTDRAAVRAALAGLRDGGATIRGVVHGAGVLADGLLADQSLERMRRVLEPKLRGVQHLAEETAADPLDFFVSFSSAAALFGSPGQVNHAAANAVLDAHAARRCAEGQPGQSIAWGAWARIGAAARKGAGERLAAIGIGELEPEEGLSAFGAALRGGVPYLGVAPVDWERFAQQPFAARPFYRRRLAGVAGAAVAAPPLDLSGLERSARLEALDVHLRTEIATVLGLGSAEEIEARSRLMDLGMDSLMAVELKARVERSLGLDLPSTLFFDHPTVESLVACLDGAVATGRSDAAHRGPGEPGEPGEDAGSPEDIAAGARVPSDAEDDAALMAELGALSDEDVVRRLRG